MQETRAPAQRDRRLNVYRAMRHLSPDRANLRWYSRKPEPQLARSVDGFGFSVPIPVDPGLKAIAGHGKPDVAHRGGVTAKFLRRGTPPANQFRA